MEEQTEPTKLLPLELYKHIALAVYWISELMYI